MSDANEEGAGLMSCNTVGHQGANDELQNVPFNILHTFTQNHFIEPLKIYICIIIKAVVFIIKKTNTGLNICSTLQRVR